MLAAFLGLGVGPGGSGKDDPAVKVPPQLELIASAHFAGMARIGADTNSAALRGFWTSPEAGALKEQTLQKLAKAPYTFLRLRMAENTNNFAALLRPLLDDLLREESYLEIRGVTNGTPELALAIHLDAARAQVWTTNLATVLATWTDVPVKGVQVEGAGGWELKKHIPPNLIRLVHAGDWIVLGCGQERLPLNEEIARRARTQGRPTAAAQDSWLSARVDWPRLLPWMPLPDGVKLPQTMLNAAGREGRLRTEVTVIYPERVNWKSEPWGIPTTTNLLDHDWEIPADRLPAWLNFSRLFLALAARPPLEGSSAARWLEAIGPKLGPTETKTTQTGSNELTLVRTSSIGLTAGELAVLANWLEAANFPWCGYQLPARTDVTNVNAAPGP